MHRNGAMNATNKKATASCIAAARNRKQNAAALLNTLQNAAEQQHIATRAARSGT